ncbi:MAG: hypothetical protein HY359_07230 [Candidatus Rokubacteria bacterium]|nr:hypothetical protein [Candidatus Rokubacteria bacterium]
MLAWLLAEPAGEAEVIERARRPFPGDPLRTLDALHLASVLVAGRGAGALALLSLDGRIRAAGRELGLKVVPE